MTGLPARLSPTMGQLFAAASTPGFYSSGGSSSDGAGAGISFALTDNFVIDAGYTAGYDGAGDPGVGIFSASSQSYIAQLSYLSGGFLDAAFAYMHNDVSDFPNGGVYRYLRWFAEPRLWQLLRRWLRCMARLRRW